MASPQAQLSKTKSIRESNPLAKDTMKKTNSLNKLNNQTTTAKSASPEPTFKDDMGMDIDTDDNVDESQRDPLQKLQSTELLPELYNLLIDLQNGQILAKDFDNNAGSIRLKIAKIRQSLQEISGISESVKFREAKIQSLKNGNEKKIHFLNKVKQKVESELEDK